MSFQAPLFLLGLVAIPLALLALFAARRRPAALRRPLPRGGHARRGRRPHRPRAARHPARAAVPLAGRPRDRARPAGGDRRRAGRAGLGDARHRHVGLDERDRRRADAARPRPRRPRRASSTASRSRCRPGSSPTPTVPTPCCARPRTATRSRRPCRRCRPTAAPRPATRSQSALNALGKRGEKSPPAAIVLLSDGASKTGRDPAEVAREAKAAGVPIYTVALGTADGIVQAQGQTLAVPPDPEALAEVAALSGGRAFAAEDADALDEVYETLGSRIGTKKEKREVSAGFAAVGLLLLGGAAFTSLRWRGRLP